MAVRVENLEISNKNKYAVRRGVLKSGSKMETFTPRQPARPFPWTCLVLVWLQLGCLKVFAAKADPKEAELRGAGSSTVRWAVPDSGKEPAEGQLDSESPRRLRCFQPALLQGCPLLLHRLILTLVTLSHLNKATTAQHTLYERAGQRNRMHFFKVWNFNG